MQRYQVVVNGNTYTVTVKSIAGSTAVVDVDGWEFQVAIGEGDEVAGVDVSTLVAAAGGVSAGTTDVRKVPAKPEKVTSPDPNTTGKKRSSALE